MRRILLTLRTAVRYLSLAANGVMNLAQSTRKYFCASLDELVYVAVNRTLRSASEIGKTHEKSLHRYIVVALVGFLVLLVLVIFTMLR